MMSVYFVVMTMCSGMEGCVDERQSTAYASREECIQTVGTMPRLKGVKYKCRKGPQSELKEARRVEGPKSFITTEAKR